MTDLRVLANVTPGMVSSDNQWMAARAFRDGSLSLGAFSRAMAQQGRVFGANFGSVTTPAVSAATTAVVLRQPQAWVRVPDGTVIVPISAEIVVESTGITTQGEIAIATTQNDVGNGTSSAGTTGPISFNTAVPVVSLCTTRQLATAADVTAEVNRVELKRFSFAVSAVNQQFSWNAERDGVYATVRGPASWLIYVGGNSVNFYAQMIWAELPESFVS